MRCHTIGDPSRLDGCRFAADDLRTQAADFPQASLAVGLGALGKDFEDCRNRFGEFLWLAGAAVYLPTDGTNVPDYLISGGTGLPDLKVLYGLACEGPWRYLARFQATRKEFPVTLSALMDACLDIAGTEMAAIAIVAESAGLVGASLKQSPVADALGHGSLRLSGGAAVAVVHAGTRVSQDIGACRRCGRAHGDGRGRAAAPAIRGHGLSGRTHARRRLLISPHTKGPSGLAGDRPRPVRDRIASDVAPSPV